MFMRYGNLSKTAAEMQISTVSVHKALHSLESALRCPLFKNEGRNLIPLKVLMYCKSIHKTCSGYDHHCK